MDRMRVLSSWLVLSLLVVAVGLFIYRLPKQPSLTPIIPSPVVRDPNNPLLGEWRLVQACGTLPLPWMLMFLPDDRFQGTLRSGEPSPEGTYHYITVHQVRLHYGNTSKDFTLTMGSDHAVLIHEEPYPNYEREVYTLCRGGNCIQGDCGAG